MRNPFRREKALSGSSEVVGALQSGWAAVPLLGGGSRQRILDIYNTAQSANYGWLYSKSPAVRTVIDAIVRSVGELELRLYEEVSESERQPRPDHPAALSMRYPNEDTPADLLLRSLIKDFLVHDNCYALLVPAAGRQVSLVRIPAFMVEVQGHSLFRAENYRVWPQGAWTSAGSWGGGGTYQDFAPEQILHWHGEHPHDPRVGLSHLDTLRGVIAEDAALQQATVELANAGLQEPTWVFRPLDAPEMNASTVRALEEDLTNRMRSRHSKPLVMTEGMEMRSFGVTPHDAEMMDLRKWAVSQIASEYNMPGGKVGLEPPSQEAEDSLIGDVLKPLCKNLAKMLNLRILVRVYSETSYTFEFNLDERLMGNDRLRALVSASGRPVLLTNEARAMVNRPPIKGGDELVTPSNVIVGEKPSPQVMPIQDPNGPPQDGSYRLDQGSANTPPKALVKQTDALPRFHPRYSAEIERQHRNIDLAQAAVQRHFNRLERSLRGKAGEADWARWDREFATDLGKTLHRIVDGEGGLYSLQLGGFDFDTRRVQHYLKAMAEGAAAGINAKIREEVTELGVDQAMSRTAQHVQSAGASLGAHSTIWAREEAARQSPDGGRGRVKTWIADGHRHQEFDGVTVGLGEDWPSGFAPGGVAGCRCTAAIS